MSDEPPTARQCAIFIVDWDLIEISSAGIYLERISCSDPLLRRDLSSVWARYALRTLRALRSTVWHSWRMMMNLIFSRAVWRSFRERRDSLNSLFSEFMSTFGYRDNYVPSRNDFYKNPSIRFYNIRKTHRFHLHYQIIRNVKLRSWIMTDRLIGIWR